MRSAPALPARAARARAPSPVGVPTAATREAEGKAISPRTCAFSSSSPTPEGNSRKKGGAASREALIFMSRPEQASEDHARSRERTIICAAGSPDPVEHSFAAGAVVWPVLAGERSKVVQWDHVGCGFRDAPIRTNPAVPADMLRAERSSRGGDVFCAWEEDPGDCGRPLAKQPPDDVCQFPVDPRAGHGAHHAA